MSRRFLGKSASQRGDRLLGLFEPQSPSAPLIQQPTEPEEEEVEPQSYLPGEMPEEETLLGAPSTPRLQHGNVKASRIDDYSDEERARNKAALEELYNPVTQDNASELPMAELPPAEDDGESNIARSLTNFLFSDEMGMIGMKWDEDGFSVGFENVKQQLVEHPYSTAFTAAMYMFPLTAAYMKAGRVATRASEMLGKTAGKRGLFGFKFDDPVDFVRKLATGAEGEGKRFFNDEMVKAIKEGGDDVVKKLIPERELKRMLSGDIQMEKALELRNLVKTGKAGKVAQAQYRLQKAFANKYYKALNGMEVEDIKNLDNFYKNTNYAKLLGAAPGPEAGQAIYKHLMGVTDYGDLAKEVGDDAAMWADSLRKHWVDLYDQQVAEGFIDSGSKLHEFFTKKLGGFHLPALKKGTPGALTLPGRAKTLVAAGGAGKVIAKESADFGALMGGATMKGRGVYTDVPKILEDIDQLITAPTELTVGGYIRDAQIFHVYKTFRDIMVDGAGNIDKWTGKLLHADDWDTLSDLAKKEWVDLNMLDDVVPGLANRMMRMIGKKSEDAGVTIGGRLPMVDRVLAEQFFGESGALAMSKVNGGIFDIFTAVHKTAGTSLNPPTHMSNLVGNMAFLAMVGMNPFSAQALNDAKIFTKAFTHIAKQVDSAKGALKFDDLLTKDELIKAFGKDRFIETKLGGQVDLAELFADDLMKELVEAQAFESVEGFRHIHRLLESLEVLEASSAKGLSYSQKATKKVAEAVVGFGEAPIIKKTLKIMSSAYLAEDMIPKMMYASKLAREGWGVESILKEVGRRLPQYKTVGDLPAASRRVLLPWITFPMEAGRILKNNMFDSPVLTTAWLNFTPLLQGLTSHATDIGTPLDDISEMKKQLPPWADKANTMMLEGDTAPEVVGGVAGGAWGGAAGAALGGAKGAALGAAGGAAAGVALQKAFGHDDADHSRSWILDFLPYSTMTPGSLSEAELTKLDPTTPDQGGLEALNAARGMLPVEPLAILMPALDIMMGRGPFGADIRTDTGMQMMSKQILGFMGILSPPVAQKYGMKLSGPDKTMVDMAETFVSNGSRMSHPKAIQGTLFGVGVGGLTALGMKRLGVPTGQAVRAGAAAGGIAGLGGREINTQRLAVDLGMEKDERTGEKGSWTLDFLTNSFFGVAKSWKATPEQQIATQQRASQRYQVVRGNITQRFNYAISSNNQDEARKEAGKAYQTFMYEHGNVDIAKEKWSEWYKNAVEGQFNLPALKGMSDETLEFRLRLAVKAYQANGRESAKQMLQALAAERHMRNQKNMSDLKFVEGGYKTNPYKPKKAKKGLYE